jgi:hypothetical protein
VSVRNVPPELGEALSWRELWRSRGFALLELAPDFEFSSLAATAGCAQVSGSPRLRNLKSRACCSRSPSRQAATRTSSRGAVRAADDVPGGGTRERAESLRMGRPRTPAHLSAVLAVAAAVPRQRHGPSRRRVGLDVLRAPAEQRDKVLDTWRGLLEAEEARWHALDSAWRPLMKVLVRLQNRYLPEVTGQTRMLYDTAQKTQVDPWPEVLSGI